jgi:tetratricopeptide (TPR) repeat protein
MTPRRFQILAALCGGLLLLISAGFAVFWLLPPADPAPPPALPTLADPNSPITNRVQFYRDRGALQAALYEVESGALTNGWSADLHQQAGDLWRDMNHINRALFHWQAAVRLSDAPSAESVRRLAAIYLERGNIAQAWHYTDRLLQIAPADDWGLFHAGAFLAASDPAQAQHYLRQSVFQSAYAEPAVALLQALESRSAGNGAQHGKRIGAVLAHQHLWALAEHAFQYTAMAYYPAPEAMAYTALMQAEQGKDGQAWLDAALALTPDNVDVRYVEGVYWRVQNNLQKSRTALQLAISIDPDNPFLLAELGLTEQLQGNLTRAETLLQEALRVSTDNDRLLQTALDNFYSKQAYLLPDDYLPFVRQIPADDPAYISAQGWALHVAGDTEAGLAEVERALAIDPQNPRALFDRARILLETGRAQQATSLLQQLASGNSPYAPAADRLLDSPNG